MDYTSPMCKSSNPLERLMYSTNAIESLNNGFCRLTHGPTIFPNAMVLTKALDLAT